MRKTIGKDIIPLLIAAFLIVISIGITMLTDYTLNYKHYFGIGLIGISSLLYFKNKTLFVYFFGLTLILGIFNIIDIYYSNIIFGIGTLKFNPIFLSLIIVFLALNKDLLNKLFPEKKLTEITQAELDEKARMLIELYVNKFQSKSEIELKKIANNKSGFVNEAKIAAKKILKEKYVL